MKRIFLTLLVLIAIVAVGAYFLFLKAITPEDLPAKVTHAEEAVATSGTIAIASVDMSYIRRIDKMFNAGKDPSPMVATKADDSKEEKSFLKELENQGVHLLSETDYALAAINISQGKPAYSFVLFGRFSQAKLERAIVQHHLIDDSVGDYLLIEELPEQGKKDDPCAKPSTRKQLPSKYAIQIQKDRILFSSPEMMPMLLKRFHKRRVPAYHLINGDSLEKKKR